MSDIATHTEDLTLMAFWLRNRVDCRPIGGIISDARAGKLPGVELLPSGIGFRVTDETDALRAMVVAR